MVCFQRLHNVYSNDEVIFIDKISSYLLEQGFFLTLINGDKSPVTLKFSEKKTSEVFTNLQENLSVSAHDVIVFYLNKERLFSIVFEHNKDIINRPENDVIFSKYNNKANASDVISDVIVHNEDYNDVIFSAVRKASESYEIRPRLSEIISDKDIKNINTKFISHNETSACVIRVSKMIENNQEEYVKYDDIDNSTLTKAVNYILSNGYRIFLLKNDFMKPINDGDDLRHTYGPCYVVARSNGGVVGFLKIITEENSNNSHVSILNNIWNSDLDIRSVLDDKKSTTNFHEDKITSEEFINDDNILKRVLYIDMRINSIANNIMDIVIPNDIFGYKENNDIYSEEEQRLDYLYKKIDGVDYDIFKTYIIFLISETIILRKSFSYLEMDKIIEKGNFNVNTQKNSMFKEFLDKFNEHNFSEKELNDIEYLYRKKAKYVLDKILGPFYCVFASFDNLQNFIKEEQKNVQSFIYLEHKNH